MAWFTWTFVPLMLVLPLVIALFVRSPKDVDVDREAIRKRMWLLTLATAGALAIFVALFFRVSEPVARFSWPLFFPLFFLFAVPVMVLKNPGWKSPHAPNTPVRTATVISRDRRNPIHWSYWIVGWWIVFVGLGGVLWRLTEPFEGHEYRSWLITTILLATIVPIGLLIGPFCVRMSMREPEPMDPSNSEQLAQAYDRYRTRRAWALYLGTIVMTLVISAAMVAVAWVPESRTLGWVGAGVGIGIGTLGGVVGTLMSFERVRITNLLRELSAKEADGRLSVEH